MDIEHHPYELSQSLAFHSGAARTVDCRGDLLLSGGIDKRVNLYKRKGTDGKFEHQHEFPFFKDYIMFVRIMDDEKFIVGCKDKNIYICAFEDKTAPMLILEGHTGPVNSVEFRGTTLISGSWDATAKIWDLESGQCIHTLEGHSYAVTVCYLENGNFLTGSQDGILHHWSKDGKKLKSLQAHTNIIRAIVEIPSMGVLTCSNDQKVKLYSLELDELTSFEDHTSFVFTLAYLQANSTDFASGGEDFKLLIYHGGKQVQEIGHPNTVWAISVDRTHQGDLITASGDG